MDSVAPTPLERAPTGLAGDRDVWLKREDVHEIGSFKWRGALPVVREAACRGNSAIVTASTGNHGAAVAWAAREHGLEAIVFVPRRANAAKLALLGRLGADIRESGVDLDSAKEAAHSFAAVGGLPYFEDGAEPLQYQAYRAIGRELVEQADGEVARVVVPVGNGALAIGVGEAIGMASSATLRVGVVASAMPVMADSFDAGHVVPPRGKATIADGLAVRIAIPQAVERLNGAVDTVVRVSERQIAAALAACHAAGVPAEPSGAAGLAALEQLDGEGTTMVVVTGRNFDPAVLAGARHHLDSFAN